jgi:hypothetical protein
MQIRTLYIILPNPSYFYNPSEHSHLPTRALSSSYSAQTMSDSYSYSDDSDELAPSKIIEKHVVEQSVLGSFARMLAMKIKAAFLARVSQ